MRRETRQRLQLYAVVLLLASIAWCSARKDNTLPPGQLLGLDPATINQVEVQAADGELRQFERRDGVWWMIQPTEAPADPAHLERLTEIAAATPLRWRPRKDFDTARIGLAKPFATLTLDGQRLVFGGLSALGPQRYVAVGDHVALIGARYTADLAATPASELAHAASTAL
ncbi:MAG TPA: hypothetical protein VFN09_03345 [Rhodanobacteraceae bacterium]|nr:hypothetical protein [Rhodanobacteraceae bacterium]